MKVQPEILSHRVDLCVVAAMAFFGLTTLGPKDPVAELMAAKATYTFHEIPFDRYMECFDKCVGRTWALSWGGALLEGLHAHKCNIQHPLAPR
jgi:hypothetical protein